MSESGAGDASQVRGSVTRGRVIRCSVIVPTLGWSRWLVPCLEALRKSGGNEVEILLVVQGDVSQADGDIAEAEDLADQVLHSEHNLGFAAANNLGFAAARGEYLATLNDDAVVEARWYPELSAALDAHPDVAAVQGIQVQESHPAIVDGAGTAWNRYWQAVQIGHGRKVESLPDAETEIFGVSATAALFRRSALVDVVGEQLQVFDDRLFAYYEDVDLACRLRQAGHRALLVPAARASHAGSQSGAQLPGGHRRLIYRNRHLVLARLLGRAYWPRLPWLVLRDKLDLARALGRGDLRSVAAIIKGGLAALGRWPRFAHFGKPRVPLSQLRGFREEHVVSEAGDG